MNINLKRINREHIVTVNGKPMVFATLIEAFKYIFEVKRNEPN